MRRCRLACGALLAVLAAPPSFATASDAQIEALLAEIEALPKDAFERDPRAWEEVFASLEQLIAAATPDARRSAPAAADPLATAFRQLAAGVRDLPVTDLASRMLSLGMNGPAATARDGAPSPIAELARWATPDRAGAPAGALDVWAMLPLFGPDSMRLLRRQAELANAGQANAEALNRGMQGTLEQLRQRATDESRQLLALRGTGSAIAQRLAALESLVQSAAPLGSGDPSSDATRLAQLRTGLATLQGQQAEALRRLGPAELNGLAFSRVPRAGSSPQVSRAALIDDIRQRAQAAGEGDPLRQALVLGRADISLAALDALAREEQLKSAALRQGEHAQDQLMQVGAEMKRLVGAVDRAPR